MISGNFHSHEHYANIDNICIKRVPKSWHVPQVSEHVHTGARTCNVASVNERRASSSLPHYANEAIIIISAVSRCSYSTVVVIIRLLFQ